MTLIEALSHVSSVEWESPSRLTETPWRSKEAPNEAPSGMFCGLRVSSCKLQKNTYSQPLNAISICRQFRLFIWFMVLKTSKSSIHMKYICQKQLKIFWGSVSCSAAPQHQRHLPETIIHRHLHKVCTGYYSQPLWTLKHLEILLPLWCVTCEQLLQGVVPGVCVLWGGVVEVQRVLLQPPPSSPAAEQSHAEHGSPRLLARRSSPLHLHRKHVLQQHHTWLLHARLTCRERGRVNTQHLDTKNTQFITSYTFC